MKHLYTIFITVILAITCNAQMPYSWIPGVNPGWSSSGQLQWRPGCLAVTTNCTGNYSANQNTTYTSPIINTICSNASTVNISFFISGNAEYEWDFLFLEYSIDNGTTWINPYGPGVGWTGNFGIGYLVNDIVAIPTSTTFRFRFNFVSDNIFNYSGYKITDFDIVCNTGLPVDLVSFNGSKEQENNRLYWLVESELNSEYYTVERSEDMISWNLVCQTPSLGYSNYSCTDTEFSNIVNYYRLSQTDNNGTSIVYNDYIVSIDNRKRSKEIIGITNILGQLIEVDSPGLVIITYSDGSVEKVFN